VTNQPRESALHDPAFGQDLEPVQFRPVLTAGRMDDHRQEVALRIDHDVPLAPFDLLARIVTPSLPWLRR